MSDHVRFPIDGMTCLSCASRITRAVRKLDGVESVKVDLGSDCCAVAFDPARTSLVAIADAVHRSGYEARVEEAEKFTPPGRHSLLERFGLGR
jgi:Cu+-exporting ATPase